MGWECNKHERGYKRITEFQSEKLKGRGHLREQDVDGRGGKN
jgi:hypothetical protein